MVRKLDRIDLHFWLGLGLIGWGASRIDLEGALLLVGSLVMLLGLLLRANVLLRAARSGR